MSTPFIEITDQIEGAFTDTIGFFNVAPRVTGTEAIKSVQFMDWSSVSAAHKIHPEYVVTYSAFKARASAITIQNRVYFLPEVLDRSYEEKLKLAIHELVHVVQYLRDGTFQFLRDYLFSYLKNLAQGYSERQAYKSIPHEVTARKVADYTCRLLR